MTIAQELAAQLYADLWADNASLRAANHCCERVVAALPAVVEALEAASLWAGDVDTRERCFGALAELQAAATETAHAEASC
jgi:hypothetical protein